MLPFNLLEIAEPHLQKLCDERCSESLTLEFKQAIPGTSDRDKSEFLKDVCAMANAEGGDIVYGIAEEEGTAKSLTPVDTTNPDELVRRLGQVLDTGLEPRLVNIQIHSVQGTSGIYLIVRIPMSFIGPHRYHFNNHSKFVVRNLTHTSELTYTQLRTAFDMTATLTESARSFVTERVAHLAQGITWKPLVKPSICALHFVPLSSRTSGQKLNVRDIYYDYARFIMQGWNGASAVLNLDGLALHGSVNDGKVLGYNQLYRSGAMEAIRTACSLSGDFIHLGSIAHFYREALSKFLTASNTYGLSGPAIVSVSIVGAERYPFMVPQGDYQVQVAGDRAEYLLPEMWVENIESVNNVDDVLRPTLDVLWQCFDQTHCTLYKPNGDWIPR